MFIFNSYVLYPKGGKHIPPFITVLPITAKLSLRLATALKWQFVLQIRIIAIVRFRRLIHSRIVFIIYCNM